MPPRTHAEQLRFLARARAGTDVVEATTTKAIDVAKLGQMIGTWFMVNHQGLEAGKPKTVFAACELRHLEEVLAALR
jgi:hypothetical protein